ncbi:hypothetical protein CDD80_3166 [Ophiocordyceps camponoti-rufipedis]|uniref:Uncharacterized protein n=1 Tax=Ophiocordyceps camponoti-rufipedis TaxID=2004952 RepID=A0A2C5YZY3_9HYPO|nr:hypothetical protein CDD80_3166 [Ophiocordyceps camponoti-rufipedis]
MQSVARRVYASVFAQWPTQALRPDYQLQDVLRQSVDERFKNYRPSMEFGELQKARALQLLVEDKFLQKLRGPMLEPKSQPTYFADLLHEIDEAPKRSWLARLGKRLSGLIRLR